MTETTALPTFEDYELCRMAGMVFYGSKAADFLLSIQDNARETWENYRDTAMASDETAQMQLDRIQDDPDVASELADSAVPIYTSDIWETFVDLQAWQEDTSELASDVPGQGEDQMTYRAKVALFLVAERLVTALFAEYAKAGA